MYVILSSLSGSIDFNTVNIHSTVVMYFLVFIGNRDHIIQYTPCSLGSVSDSISWLPWANMNVENIDNDPATMQIGTL